MEEHSALTWRVMRQDDNGNRFVVAEGLGEEAARKRAEELASRGHKQVYWSEPEAGRED